MLKIHSIIKSVLFLTAALFFTGLFTQSVNSQVLVLVHDTNQVTSQLKRLADRDTLKKYLPNYLTSGYTLRTFDTTTTFPDLANFCTIIVQETSFDAITCRWMGLALRNQVRAWLLTGTPAAKKSLIMIGGDLAYNYDRTGSAGIDTSFARGVLGIIYLADNGNLTSQNGAYRIAGTIKDSVTTSPPGTGFYPDSFRPSWLGPTPFYGHSGRGANDSLCGVTRVTANYNVVALTQDPRYFVSLGGSAPSPNRGFNRVLQHMIAIVQANGTCIAPTGITGNNTIPSVYKLEQNYPNPFNPSTTINFSIPKEGYVSMVVYDNLGKEVQTLVNENIQPGNYSVTVDGSALSSGIYYYKLITDNFTATKKMILVK